MVTWSDDHLMRSHSDRSCCCPQVESRRWKCESILLSRLEFCQLPDQRPSALLEMPQAPEEMEVERRERYQSVDLSAGSCKLVSFSWTDTRTP